ncbi:transcriptional regulator [Loigolactobacillus bifermentans]|nr:transcriptional regulator [Loigolactobacillus bifermentans]QGG61299.1 transcriptional regulator [Loigolactobacillus bifermentans]
MTTITRYSFETNQNETYEQIFQRALYPVKGEKIYITAERYRRLSDGEFFEPFDDPDRNLNRAFQCYRDQHHLLSPDQIKATRLKYHLSIRDFTKILGIGYGNLSSIENGAIQTPYIDALITMAAEPMAFKRLVLQKQALLTPKVYTALTHLFPQLITTSQNRS